MRVVVICGGGRGAGKTTLARRMCDVLPGARVVKLGRGAIRPECDIPLLPPDAILDEAARAAGRPDWLVLESGAILDDPTFAPDLVVFVPAASGDKPGSGSRRARADIICGQSLDPDRSESLRRRLGLAPPAWAALLRAADVVVETVSPLRP